MKKFILLLLLCAGSAQAGLISQSEPDENGRVVCWYENFNTGEQYSKSSLYVCPSS